jgi:hypothetical protein
LCVLVQAGKSLWEILLGVCVVTSGRIKVLRCDLAMWASEMVPMKERPPGGLARWWGGYAKVENLKTFTGGELACWKWTLH